MIGKKLKNPPPLRKQGGKRAAVVQFVRNLFLPKATMPDPALQWASSCFFPTTFHKVPLLSVKDYNYDTKIFTFALPEDVALDLPIASCLQMQGFDEEGNEAIRAYTPISSNSVTGSFELLVKVYPKGVVTKWLAGLKPGVGVSTAHPLDPAPCTLHPAPYTRHPSSPHARVARGLPAPRRRHQGAVPLQRQETHQHDLRRHGRHTHVPNPAGG